MEFIAKLFQKTPARPLTIPAVPMTDEKVFLPARGMIKARVDSALMPGDPPVEIPRGIPVTKLVFTPPAGRHEPSNGDPVCDACSAVYQRGWCDGKVPGSKCPRA